MKKIFIGIFIAGLLFSAAMYVRQTGQKAYLREREISAVELQDLLRREELFYLYFYTDTCDQCLSAEPKLSEALRQVPVSLYTMDSVKNAALFAAFQQEYRFPGVPVVLRFEKGKVTSGRAGSPESKDVYAEFFRETGTGR